MMMSNNNNNKIIDNIILANKLKEASQQEYAKKFEQLSEQIVQQIVQPMDRTKMKDSLTKILQEEQAKGNTDPVEKILNDQMNNIEQMLQQVKDNVSAAVESLFSEEFAKFEQISQTANSCSQDLAKAVERFKAIENILGCEWDGTKEVKKNGDKKSNGNDDDNGGNRRGSNTPNNTQSSPANEAKPKGKVAPPDSNKINNQ